MELQRLMQAVIADPEADAPRAAYADACESIAPDRAEFIRIEIAYREYLRANRTDFFPGTQRAVYLRRKHGAAWAGEIGKLVSWYEFFRGFVEKISLDARDFLAKADELCALAPIRRLDLTNVAPVARDLFASPHLSRIVSLSIEGQQFGDDEAELLAGSRYLGKLAWLNLAANNIGRTGLAAMVQSEQLGALRHVDLHRNPVFGSEIDDDHSDDQGRVMVVYDGLYPIEKVYRPRIWLHTVRELGERYIRETTW
jgi:uncharacterized protein (TIGR02996 family)